MACDITQLQADACANKFSCLPTLRAFDVVLAQLLCEIKDALAGVGGGSGITCGNYGGGEPTFVPATGCGGAIDTSNERIWWYYSGAWH